MRRPQHTRHERGVAVAAHARAATAFGARFVAPIALGSTLNPINSNMIATALVPIGASFHAGSSELSWLIAGLYLASAAAQPTMGRLADLGGPRRVYLISLALLGVAGVFGPFAPSIAALIALRVLIGIATSGAYPSAMRLLRTRADECGIPAPRSALGWLSFAGMSSGVIGPTLGGVLTAAFGWHAIFVVNVPLAMVIAVLVLLWVPPDPPRAIDLRLLLRDVDVVGVAWFTATLVGLMVFLLSIAHPVWPALVASAAAAALLIRHSLRRKGPFIDVRMLARNRPLAFTYVRVALALTICYAFMYGFAEWLEAAAHRSSAQAGLAMLPMSLSAAAFALLGARTRGIRLPFLFSAGTAVLACLCGTFLRADSPFWLIALTGFLFGPAQGMFQTATQAAIYVQAPPGEIGIAAGLQRTGGYIGAVLAMSVLGGFFAHGVDDGTFRSVNLVLAALSGAMFAWVVCDRTIPRGSVGTRAA